MPFQKIILRGGLNTQRTQLAQQGGWHAANLMRFREGLPEVHGGWTTFLPNPVMGVPRALHAWQTLAAVPTLGIATSQLLYVSQFGNINDITPIVATETLTDPFTTQAGSSIVTVTDATTNPTPGDSVIFSGATAVGGVTVSGQYFVIGVPTSTTYTISVAPAVASSSATGGGTVTAQYLLPSGQVNATSSAGWGTGLWGHGTWGTSTSGNVGVTFPRLWTLDNWGENLIACPRGLGIYQWVAASGPTVRAVVLSGAPTTANGAIVASPLQILIALGCNPPAGGAQDPMLVAWSDQGDNTNWTPAPTNQAGSFRLANGSQIMQGLISQQQILIGTDTTLYGMQYLGAPLVFGFSQLGVACGFISPNAGVVIGGQLVWMSDYEFWQYNGQAFPMDCPIRDLVFKNLNRSQQSKVVAASNTQWSEVTWYYPSSNSNEIDSYATVNLGESPPAWYYGSLSRTAAIDDNVFGNPIDADPTGVIYNTEQGNAINGAAMPWSIQSGYVDISQGEEFAFVDLFVPDQVLTGSCNYTFYATRFVGDTPQVYGPFVVTPGTQFLPLRIRARQIAMQVDNSGNVVNNFWRMGSPEFRIARDGRW